MKNPCIGVCKFDEEVCRGCGRTRHEIRQWKKQDKAGKRHLQAEADMRLIVLESAGRRLRKK